jgi:hypothetical protein
VPYLIKVGPIELVISRWLCENLLQARMGQRLSNPSLSLFWELICVLQYLQHTQMHPSIYFFENILPLGDFDQLFWLVGNKLRLDQQANGGGCYFN